MYKRLSRQSVRWLTKTMRDQTRSEAWRITARPLNMLAFRAARGASSPLAYQGRSGAEFLVSANKRSRL